MKNNQGPSAVELSKCCSLKGTLLKKGQVKWNERYFVLKEDEGKLYYFDAETSASPRGIIDFSRDKVRVKECIDCKTGAYCFSVISDTKTHTMCAEKSKIQEEWIEKILQAGAAFVEDESLGTIGAKSLFEFTALDIEKDEVNLNTFQGKVCLIVNVACF